MQNVLITGGTGLVGNSLVPVLQDKGYGIAVLSRKKFYNRNFEVYQWDIEKRNIEEEAIASADYIIHLAGANIGEKRWTKKRKGELLKSRVESSGLLYEYLSRVQHKVKAVISSSAVGYYGHGGERIFSEDARPAGDFLGQVCRQWEESVYRISNLGIRVVILRLGIVLSPEADILNKFELPLKFFIAPVFGSGNQFMPWIHIDDLNSIILKAIEDEKMMGVYNAATPYPVTNKDFVAALSKLINRHSLKISVPRPVLKIALGEFGNSLFSSIRVSPQKIMDAGFEFRYVQMEDALKEIYRR